MARRLSMGNSPPDAIAPDTKILDDHGNDWAWAFVVFRRPIGGNPAYRVGTDGSFWSRSNQGLGRTGRYGVAGEEGPWRRSRPFVRGKARHRMAMLREADGRKSYTLLHRLILATFIGPCPDGAEGCHNNDDPSDNRLCNLRWDTHRANAQDAIRNGRWPLGEASASAKTTVDDVRAMRRASASGVTNGELAERYGLHRSTVCRIVNRKAWAHVAKEAP